MLHPPHSGPPRVIAASTLPLALLMAALVVVFTICVERVNAEDISSVNHHGGNDDAHAAQEIVAHDGAVGGNSDGRLRPNEVAMKFEEDHQRELKNAKAAEEELERDGGGPDQRALAREARRLELAAQLQRRGKDYPKTHPYVIHKGSPEEAADHNTPHDGDAASNARQTQKENEPHHHGDDEKPHLQRAGNDRDIERAKEDAERRFRKDSGKLEIHRALGMIHEP